MNRGVVIVAVGEKTGKSDYSLYGRLAFNLALSLKCNNKDCDITLLYTEDAISDLKDWHLAYFDKFIKVPSECYKQNGINHFHKTKLWLYWLSPYDETIYIDADALWLPHLKKRQVKWRDRLSNIQTYTSTRDINTLFDSLKGKIFTGCMGGYYDIKLQKEVGNKYISWVKKDKTIKDVVEYHKLTGGYIPRIQSSFLYFDKSEKTKQIFIDAKNIYEDDEVPCENWANGKPDEYFFNIAYAKSGLTPDNNIFPVAIEYIERYTTKVKIIAERYDIFSNCGAGASISVKIAYNTIVDYYCNQQNIMGRFYHQDKKTLIQERING